MHRFFGRLWRKRIDWELDARPGSKEDAQPAVEKVENRLLTILEMVNEWLQFAEAKNAGLVALDALGLAAILTIVPDVELPEPIAWGLVVASMLLLVSLGISMWSFIPRSDIGKLVSAARRQPRATDNLYFYGDIRGYRPEQLAAEIACRYDKICNYDPRQHPSHVDLASQVIANSRITVAKNGYFRVATWIALLALAASAIGMVLALALRF
jgi:hypothetical protein